MSFVAFSSSSLYKKIIDVIYSRHMHSSYICTLALHTSQMYTACVFMCVCSYVAPTISPKRSPILFKVHYCFEKFLNFVHENDPS